MNRILLRQKRKDYDDSNKVRDKYAILGLGPETGVTTIGTILARMASKRTKGLVQYLELRDNSLEKPLIFDAYGMDQRFNGREFIDFYERVKKGENISKLINREEGMGWVLTLNPRKKKANPLTIVEKLHLIHNLTSDLLFCDISYKQNSEGNYEELSLLLREMTRVILIIDPMPAKLLSSVKTLSLIKSLEEKGKEVYYFINKFNAGVNKRELFDYLKIKADLIIPQIPLEEFYKIQYNLDFPDAILPLSRILEGFANSRNLFK